MHLKETKRMDSHGMKYFKFLIKLKAKRFFWTRFNFSEMKEMKELTNTM